MIIKDLIQIGNPKMNFRLKDVSDYKDPQVIKLIQDLKDTLYHHELVGIASNQIGGKYRIFVTEVRKTSFRNPVDKDMLRIYVNPSIIRTSREMEEIYEGCGSVAYSKLMVKVKRPKEIKIKAFDEEGRESILEAKGLLARVILHEMDHLNNIEFIEKVDDWKSAMSSEEYKKRILNRK